MPLAFFALPAIEDLPGADKEQNAQYQRKGCDDHVQIPGDEDLFAQEMKHRVKAIQNIEYDVYNG